MARFSVTAKGVATGVAAKTILQVLAPGTKSLHIVRARISLNGATAAAVPGDVDLLRQTTAGTPGSAPTPIETDEAGNAAGATAGINYSAEPTAGDVVDSIKLTPYGGIWEWAFDLCELVVPAGGRLAIRCTFAATVDATAHLTFVEV